MSLTALPGPQGLGQTLRQGTPGDFQLTREQTDTPSPQPHTWVSRRGKPSTVPDVPPDPPGASHRPQSDGDTGRTARFGETHG